jgi:hypothetical protein
MTRILPSACFSITIVVLSDVATRGRQRIVANAREVEEDWGR